MEEKHLRSWKKVYEADLIYIINELKESVEKPATLILDGELGSGKTTFTKHFCQDGEVQSPTYSVVSETPTLVFADFYRLEKKEDVLHLELEHYLDNKDYFLVEWGKSYAETLRDVVGDDHKFYELKIKINKPSETLQSPNPSRNYDLYELSFGY